MPSAPKNSMLGGNPAAMPKKAGSPKLAGGAGRAGATRTPGTNGANEPGIGGLANETTKGFSAKNEKRMATHNSQEPKAGAQPTHHTPTVHPLARPTAKPLLTAGREWPGGSPQVDTSGGGGSQSNGTPDDVANALAAMEAAAPAPRSRR